MSELSPSTSEQSLRSQRQSQSHGDLPPFARREEHGLAGEQQADDAYLVGPEGVTDGASEVAGAAGDASHAALFPKEKAQELDGQWQSIQASFVDDPRNAIQ